MAASEHANPNERDSPSSGPGDAAHTPNPKRWYERTSVTLCVAAGLAVVGSGFLHVILGATSSFGLPFDVALRSAFGYREMIVDVRKLGALPYAVARFKYPLSIAALQKRGYLPEGPAFEAGMTARQQERIARWQRDFEESALARRETCPLDRLRGDVQVADIDPQDARACNQRGIAFARNGEYQSAIAEFTKAAAIDPKSAETIFHRSLVYFVRGDYEKALEDAMKIEGLGQAVPTEFLRALRGESDQDGMEISTSLEE